MNARDYVTCAGCGDLVHYTEVGADGKCSLCGGRGSVFAQETERYEKIIRSRKKEEKE